MGKKKSQVNAEQFLFSENFENTGHGFLTHSWSETSPKK